MCVPKANMLFQTILQCFCVFSRKQMCDMHLNREIGVCCLEKATWKQPFSGGSVCNMAIAFAEAASVAKENTVHSFYMQIHHRIATSLSLAVTVLIICKYCVGAESNGHWYWPICACFQTCPTILTTPGDPLQSWL